MKKRESESVSRNTQKILTKGERMDVDNVLGGFERSITLADLMDHRNVFEIEDEIINDIRRSYENQNTCQRSLISFL